MIELDFLTFVTLFKEAYWKCFGFAMENPLTETESKIFCNKITGLTGLSIGWKSVKNYSFFVMDSKAGKKENPSVATLDTLARYVLEAPYTTEIQRKNDESHYPYWFLYRERIQKTPGNTKSNEKRLWIAVAVIMSVIIALGIYLRYELETDSSYQFTEYFHNTDEHVMNNNGWFIKSKDNTYWNKRAVKPGQLTLYTLRGDYWPDPSSKPDIKNLLLHPIPAGCFTAEVHFSDFIPQDEWQQAGILLLEDTSFTGKSIRMSLAFNDNFGGMKMPREILIQAITSLGQGFGKPEEIAHKPIFFLDSLKKNPALFKNLKNSALRIEKSGNKYRFLYAGGVDENTAFKEVVSQEFDMKPKYIGIFAIRGFTNSVTIPVSFKFFRISANTCAQ
ncbi:hypothetical protein JN11_03796 [Mucilaginibacter frigoritolerans]|uniref:Uncharacterized protein n=1 Tax=Mucilaginibacter frigoritolerans TaxID=652788 RepID=A0A562TU02_9SPHI|nr:hypothetical protein [Mucilaginibacter frigoritolerans]TWI96684.1 hypothetical protein JN11_03796 [Mucilaginibacter frigoritolerans]